MKVMPSPIQSPKKESVKSVKVIGELPAPELASVSVKNIKVTEPEKANSYIEKVNNMSIKTNVEIEKKSGNCGWAPIELSPQVLKSTSSIKSKTEEKSDSGNSPV